MANATLILGVPSPDDDRPGCFVHAPYDEQLRAELLDLPTEDRRWVPHEDAWWVAEEHEDWLVEKLVDLFGSVEVVDDDGVVETRDRSGGSRQEPLF